jgi:hypothetical protein
LTILVILVFTGMMVMAPNAMNATALAASIVIVANMLHRVEGRQGLFGIVKDLCQEEVRAGGCGLMA